VGRRERQGAEANIEYGIELAARAASIEEILLGDVRELFGRHPEGVYHG
jgi:hypothetical protein